MATGLISSLRRSRSFYLLAICLSLFTDTFLYAVIVPVLPFSLSERANIPQSDVQTASALLLTTYGATMLFASPLVGFIADRTSRRFSFLFGLIGLAGSSLLFYLGRQLWVLFVARVLQGFAAATVLTVAFALISEVFSKDQLGYVFGYTELSMTFGSVLGPSVGAVVFDNLGYYAVFQVILGIIAVDVLSRLIMGDKTTLKHSSGKTKIPPSDPSGFGTFQDEERNQQQEEEEQRQGEDSKSKKTFSVLDPFLHMLRSPRVITGLFGIFTQATVQSAFDGILPLYLKYTFDWSPSLVGLVFLAFATPSLFAPMVGKMCSKWPPRRLALISFTMQIPNQLVLGCVQQSSMLHKFLLWVSLVNLGICLALAFTPLRLDFELATDEVEKEMTEKSPNNCEVNISAQGYGLYNSCFSLGMLVGPLWADFGVTYLGWRGMTCSLGVLSFFAANLVYFNMGRPRNAGYAVVHN